MTAFAIIAALLLLCSLVVIVIPLLRRSASTPLVERREVNLQILRDQLAELDADLANGTLSPEQHRIARAELERRTLDESQQEVSPAGTIRSGRRWIAPVVIGIAMPVIAIGLYLHLGDTDGLDVEGWVSQQASSITPDDVARMMHQLEQHLQENPDDVEGWAMMGRSRRALGQFDAAAKAWNKVMQLAPKNADAVANYAEALGLAAQGDLAGKPTQLLQHALELDPENAKALALSGSAAFARDDYAAAIGYWEKLLALSGDDPELAEALKTGIAEARSRLGLKPGGTASTPPKVAAGNSNATASSAAESGSAKLDSVAGTVTIAPALSKSVNPDDMVFIFAKAAQGPGMPLAVARVKVSDLPYQFHLDDSMAMTPARKISDFEQLVVGARVSNNGSATRSSGDLEGFSKIVTAGDSDVRVVIDQRVP